MSTTLEELEIEYKNFLDKTTVIYGQTGSGKSKLDPFKLEIEGLLKNGSSKTFVAKRYKTSLRNFYKWLNKHNIK